MKPVKLFYLKNCPFCKKALRYIEEPGPPIRNWLRSRSR